MSILIPGKEMPKSCSRCALFDEGSNGDPDWCKVMHQVPEYETCPLIEIPPHGRLIDADAFIKRIKGLAHRAEADGFDLGAVWYTAFIRHIELAPTILEEEEGET
jgi:hypothetical protein